MSALADLFTEKRNATFTVLVTGSRTWTDQACVEDALDELLISYGSLVLIHGACPKGVDAMADQWGRRRASVLIDRYPAQWSEHGKAAGPMRNIEMVQTGPDLCLAFILNNSRGASHCLKAAQRAGVTTRVYRRWSRLDG